MTDERLMNPTLIDRIGLINFKYRREIELLCEFTRGMHYGLHRSFGDEPFESSCWYNWETMSFHVSVGALSSDFSLQYPMEEVLKYRIKDYGKE